MTILQSVLLGSFRRKGKETCDVVDAMGQSELKTLVCYAEPLILHDYHHECHRISGYNQVSRKNVLASIIGRDWRIEYLHTNARTTRPSRLRGLKCRQVLIDRLSSRRPHPRLKAMSFEDIVHCWNS